jgi:uncharacterized small protein (DUF1192 family)
MTQDEKEQMRLLKRQVKELREQHAALAQFLERLKLERCAACLKKKSRSA